MPNPGWLSDEKAVGVELIVAAGPSWARANADWLAQQALRAGFTVQVEADSQRALTRAAVALLRGPVALASGALVTGPAMLEALLRSSRSTVLLAEDADPPAAQAARVVHRRLVSAGSRLHNVTLPGHRQLGFVVLYPADGLSDQLQAAGRLLSDDAVAAATVALVRSGQVVSPSYATGVCGRAETQTQLTQLRSELAEQEEELVRLRRALRADDGFYSTFVLRKISRRLTMLALSRGWSPNQLTIASLVMALSVAAMFATGQRWALAIGAILWQASIVADCADGEVARYSGKSSRVGAWLDAATDRIKEYAVYAGLALGAGAAEWSWQLALALMTLQTLRHLGDYNFAAVQTEVETRSRVVDLRQSQDAFDSDSAGLLGKSAAASRHRGVYWLKKVIHLPIGERWLIISIGAAFGEPMLTLMALFLLGMLAFGYTTLGRLLRVRKWHAAAEGAILIERQLDLGPLATFVQSRIMKRRSATPTAQLMVGQSRVPLLQSRYNWAIPSLLRLVEFAALWGCLHSVGIPVLFTLVYVLVFHYYDALYRALSGHAIPTSLTFAGLGIDGRILLAVILALAGWVSVPSVLAITAWLALSTGVAASLQWLRTAQ